MPTCFQAAWVVPVDAPPRRAAAVATAEGRIAGIVEQPGPGDDGVDLGNVALLPGLVNPHTHLELTAFHGRIAPCNFWDWLEQLVPLRRAAPPDREPAAVADGAALSLAAGVTLVGDISRPHQAWAALEPLPLRKVCFAELLSFAESPARNAEELATLVDGTRTDDRLFVGVSPHSPYTVYPQHFRDTVALARRRGLRITTHAAETLEEIEFCRHGTGRLVSLLEQYGQTEHIPSPGATPIEYLHDLGALDIPTLLAHVNYLDDAGLTRLAASPCSVVYCPRAHAYFGHSAHPFARMLAAGINVALGTDSAASLPEDDGYAPLSVLDEARFVHALCPNLPTATLLEMITINAALALGLADHAGSITPGKWADLTAVPLDPHGPADPIQNLLESRIAPTTTIIAGQTV